MMLVVLLVPAAWTRAVAAPAPGDLAGIRDLLAQAPLDLGEKDLGDPTFHGDKVAAARAARAGIEAASEARRVLVLVLGIYGSLAAIWAAVCVAWRFPRRLPWEMPVLMAGATAALVVLGAGWNGADVLVITQVILTDSAGNGGEQTRVDVETLRQRTTHVAVPYPKSALRWMGAGARFGSPLRIDVERALVEREALDGMVIAGLAPVVEVAAPLAARTMVPRLEIRDGKPWIVNPTPVAYAHVVVCLGRGMVQPYVPALRWWALPGDLPGGEERPLEPTILTLLGRERPSCEHGPAIGRYWFEGVVVSPGDLRVRADPALPARTRVVSIVADTMPGEVVGP
jgi:hypothetical protein